MFGKISVLIVCIGVCACGLLAARQMRTQAAHELAQSRLRAVQLETDIGRAHARIAASISPERVMQMAAKLDSLKPLAGEFGPHPGGDRRDTSRVARALPQRPERSR